MFTTENTPRYGQIVMHGSKVVTVRSFMGVIADAVYGTTNAWASVQDEQGNVYNCSLYELSPT
jgi:hypothetical protein